MTALYLCLVFLLPPFSIWRDMARDNATTRTEQDIARITAPLPDERRDLSDWPVALSPLDLPGIGDTDVLAAIAEDTQFAAQPVPPVAELGGGKHRLGVAPGTDTQRMLWNSPTGQFWLIVDNIGDLWDPCSHCSSPEDGEPAHVGCPGCSCPCSLMEAAA